MTNYLLVDGSYFIFYRFHAVLAWWRKKTNVNMTNLINEETFVKTFKKTFVSKLNEIPNKLSIDSPIVIICKDCPRQDIWRNDLIKNYKGGRKKNTEIGPFFKLAYDSLFKESNINHIFKHNKLEADDCCAILTKWLLKIPSTNINIITSDHDYLQLIQPRVHLFNLKMRPVQTEKNSTGDPKKDLFIKIITGDKSDNIPGLFKGVGKKTAAKFYDNDELFQKKLEKVDPIIKLHLDRNINLIDFNKIPENYVNELIIDIVDQINT
jgi:5'-3' exonuclease